MLSTESRPSARRIDAVGRPVHASRTIPTEWASDGASPIVILGRVLALLSPRLSWAVSPLEHHESRLRPQLQGVRLRGGCPRRKPRSALSCVMASVRGSAGREATSDSRHDSRVTLTVLHRARRLGGEPCTQEPAPLRLAAAPPSLPLESPAIVRARNPTGIEGPMTNGVELTWPPTRPSTHCRATLPCEGDGSAGAVRADHTLGDGGFEARLRHRERRDPVRDAGGPRRARVDRLRRLPGAEAPDPRPRPPPTVEHRAYVEVGLCAAAGRTHLGLRREPPRDSPGRRHGAQKTRASRALVAAAGGDPYEDVVEAALHRGRACSSARTAGARKSLALTSSTGRSPCSTSARRSRTRRSSS